MLRKCLAAALALGAVTLTACSESLGPNVSATEEERTEVIQVAEESGFFADGFGVEGAFDESDGAPAALMGAAAAGEVVVPRVWGRRKGLPIRRVITVEVDREAGIASITKELVFDGEFLLDLSDDDVINPASKPLEVTLLLHAEFMRLDEPNDRGRRWQLKGVSAAQWYMTDAAKQTVNLTKVEVYVDDVLVLLVTDPSELLQLENDIPLIDKDDLVVVRAWVDNTSDSASVNEPATFGFLHVFHARSDRREWRRMPMDIVQDGDDVYYEKSWLAHRVGRARIAIDMIDSEMFSNETEDDYRGNAWGIPYRIMGPNGEEEEGGS